MVSMSFKLRLNRPVSSVECIYPDSFVLKIKGMTFIERMVEFDFKVYNFKIIDGYTIDCVGMAMDTGAFPSSERIMMMLSERKGVSWAGVFIYCGVDPDSGMQAEPVGIYDVEIYDKRWKCSLPNYEFKSERSKTLSKTELSIVKDIMGGLVMFCATNFYDNNDDLIRLYESNNRIYVRTTSGLGYFYDVDRDSIGFIGGKFVPEELGKAKELLTDAITKLSNVIPFPVNCITALLKSVTEGKCYASKRESCAFDIVLK